MIGWGFSTLSSASRLSGECPVFRPCLPEPEAREPHENRSLHPVCFSTLSGILLPQRAGKY